MCYPEGETTIQQPSRKRKFEEPDATMVMLEVEQKFARQLKAARREDDDERDPMSDLAYAHHAIESFGAQSDEAILKAQGMRTVMTKMGVQDSVKDAMQCLGGFFDRYPDILLKIDLCGSTQDGVRYFAVLDLAAILQGLKAGMESEEDKKTLMSGLFYLTQCLFPHTSAMRGGTTLIFECGGVEWDDFNKDEAILRLWEDLYCCYPVTFRDAWFYNTTDQGTQALTLLGLRTLPKDVMNRIYLGCKMDVEGKSVSLKELFPWSSEDKQSIFLQETEKLLMLRYQNEKKFNL